MGGRENGITRNFIICTLQKTLAYRKINEYEMEGAKSVWHITNCKEIFVKKRNSSKEASLEDPDLHKRWILKGVLSKYGIAQSV